MNETTINSAFERGLVYRNLGLVKEAEAEFRAVPKSCDAFPDAQAHIISLLFITKRLKKAVAYGFELLAQGYQKNYKIVNATVHALHYCERYVEALELSASVVPSPEEEVNYRYEIACLEARLGNFSITLKILADVLTEEPYYRAKSLVDSDLREFWYHYSCVDLNSKEKVLFTRPGFLSLHKDIFNTPENDLFDVPDYLATAKKYHHFFLVGEFRYSLILNRRLASSHTILWNEFQELRKGITANILLIAYGILGRAIRAEIESRIQSVDRLTAKGDVFHARELVMDLLRVEPLEPSLFKELGKAFPTLAYYLEEIEDGRNGYPSFISHLNFCRKVLKVECSPKTEPFVMRV